MSNVNQKLTSSRNNTGRNSSYFINNENSFNAITSTNQGLIQFFSKVEYKHKNDSEYEILITDELMSNFDIMKSNIVQDKSILIFLLSFKSHPSIICKIDITRIYRKSFDLKDFVFVIEKNNKLRICLIPIYSKIYKAQDNFENYRKNSYFKLFFMHSSRQIRLTLYNKIA